MIGSSERKKSTISEHELNAITDWTQRFRDVQLENQFRDETFFSFRSHALKTWIMVWSSWLGVGVLLALGVWVFDIHLTFQTHLSYFSAAFVFATWFALERSEKYRGVYEFVQLGVLIGLIGLTVSLVNSLPDSIQRNAYPFYVLAIVLTYITLDLSFKKALLAGLTGTMIIAVTGFATKTYPTVAGGPFLFFSILIAANSLGVAVFRYTDQQRRLQFLTRRLLDVEKTRSDQLLNAVFPTKVAESLRHGLKVDPVRVDDVSVIFTDLGGFTGWSSGANPKEIVDAVEAMFGAFDELAVTYGIDKIKTIGDAYMACSGLTSSSPQQFRNAIEFGREAIKVVERMKPLYFRDAPQIGLRVGIATGPVVAGVMGKIKPSFDVWGETVNLASRLESSGRIGHISVCNRTTEFIPDLYALGETVQLQLKGVGIYNAFQFSGVKDGGVIESRLRPNLTQ